MAAVQSVTLSSYMKDVVCARARVVAGSCCLHVQVCFVVMIVVKHVVTRCYQLECIPGILTPCASLYTARSIPPVFLLWEYELHC